MYNKKLLLIKHFQDHVKEAFINERTPFYFISTICMFFSILLSYMSAIYNKENFSDFFPTKGQYYGMEIHDNTILDKTCWYFSQITHHTITLLFFYFFLAFINRKSENYFKMVAPLALTISILYFILLFPRQQLSLHQLPFYNFFSHFMIIFLVFGEIIYVNNYTFEETTHCFIFILTCLCSIFINYTLRGVWSYNLIKLDSFSGWKLVSKTVILMYMLSFGLFALKNRSSVFSSMNLSLKHSYFFSGMIGIILFNSVSTK
jgi:hypothetical protein